MCVCVCMCVHVYVRVRAYVSCVCICIGIYMCVRDTLIDLDVCEPNSSVKDVTCWPTNADDFL